MTICNFCSERESCSDPYVCNECHDNTAGVTFIDAFHKRYEISSDHWCDINNSEYFKPRIREKDMLIASN